MTPLAMKFFSDLTLPLERRRVDDRANVLKTFDRDLHCFEVTAVGMFIEDAMDEADLFGDAATIMPRTFLPSPVTWLEMQLPDHTRWAWVLEKAGRGFRLALVRDDHENIYSLPMCEFWDGGVLSARRIDFEADPGIEENAKKWVLENKFSGTPLGSDILDAGMPIDKRLAALEARSSFRAAEVEMVETTLGRLTETQRLFYHGIIWSVLMLDLINTPGVVGLRHHDAHRGLARRLAAGRVAHYPLRGWSEIVLKHQTVFAEDPQYSIASCHKCLHFVRSHLRHYRDGHVTTIPAHWRGDPALGIKRTRYRLAA